MDLHAPRPDCSHILCPEPLRCYPACINAQKTCPEVSLVSPFAARARAGDNIPPQRPIRPLRRGHSVLPPIAPHPSFATVLSGYPAARLVDDYHLDQDVRVGIQVSCGSSCGYPCSGDLLRVAQRRWDAGSG